SECRLPVRRLPRQRLRRRCPLCAHARTARQSSGQDRGQAARIGSLGSPAPFLPGAHCDVETTAYFKEPAASEAEASAPKSSVAAHGRNYAWAELMKRVWALDMFGMPALSRP